MIRIFSLAFLSIAVLSACTPLGIATGLGATVGVAATQEGGISAAVDDARIQIEINDLWFKYDFRTFSKLDLTINQGRVLVTGVVQDPEHRVEAVRLAWQPSGVQQVINEVRVAKSDGILGFAKDTWITTRIRTALTFDREIESINYSIDTVQGTVYLMGFAQNKHELNRVIETARTVNGVDGVVSYVKFVGGLDDPSGHDDDHLVYQSTYDDQLVYPEQNQGVYVSDDQPVDLQTQPRRLTAPNYNNEGAGGYAPAPVERVEAPIVIRENPLAPYVPEETTPVESERILWNGQ